MNTPDRPVSTQPPGKGLAEGSTTYPLGRGAPVAPIPGAPNDAATNARPNTSPLPSSRPDDLVRRR